MSNADKISEKFKKIFVPRVTFISLSFVWSDDKDELEKLALTKRIPALKRLSYSPINRKLTQRKVSLKNSAAAAKKVSFSFQISILIWRLCTLRILDTYTPSQFDSIRILVPHDIKKIVNKSIILKISRTFIFNNNKAETLTNCLRKKLSHK